MKRLLRFLLAAAALLAAWFLVFQLRKDPEGAFLVRWSGPSPIPAGAPCVALGEGDAPDEPAVLDAFEELPVEGARVSRLVLRSSARDGRPAALEFWFERIAYPSDGSARVCLRAAHAPWDGPRGERWGGEVVDFGGAPGRAASVRHRGRGTPRALSVAAVADLSAPFPVFCLLHDGTAPGAAALEAEFEADPAAAVRSRGPDRRGFVLWVRPEGNGPAPSRESVEEAGRALREALAERLSSAERLPAGPWRFWPHDFADGPATASAFTNEAETLVAPGRRVRARLVFETDAPGRGAGPFATGLVHRVRAEARLETLRGGEWRPDPRFDLRLARDGVLGTDARGLPFCGGSYCDGRTETRVADVWTPSGRRILALSLDTHGPCAPLASTVFPADSGTQCLTLSSVSASVGYDGRALPLVRRRSDAQTGADRSALGPFCSFGLSVPLVNVTVFPPAHPATPSPAAAESHAESAEAAESGSPAGGAGERSETEGVSHAENAETAEP